MDGFGRTAVHTGEKCIAHAGHIARGGYSVQANMMLKNTVWGAMANAFEKSTGPLAGRLFSALLAAKKEGGDIRGMQSACILVVDNIRDDEPWKHFKTDIRIDDHPNPIEEMRRLLDLDIAYNLMNEGDYLMGENKPDEAKEKYMQAAQMAPEIDEIPFWQAVSMAESGFLEDAIPIFKKVFEMNKNWAELVKRLPASGLLNVDDGFLKRILNNDE